MLERFGDNRQATENKSPRRRRLLQRFVNKQKRETNGNVPVCYLRLYRPIPNSTPIITSSSDQSTLAEGSAHRLAHRAG